MQGPRIPSMREIQDRIGRVIDTDPGTLTPDHARIALSWGDVVWEFFNIYEIAHMHNPSGYPRGTAPLARKLAELIEESAEEEDIRYYDTVLNALQVAGLIVFDNEDGYPTIPLYGKANPEMRTPGDRILPAFQVAPFERFKAVYPRQKFGSSEEAKREWAKLNPFPAEVDRMVEAVELFKQTQKWQDGVIPHARRFLHGRWWEDMDQALAEIQPERTQWVRSAPRSEDTLETPEARERRERIERLGLGFEDQAIWSRIVQIPPVLNGPFRSALFVAPKSMADPGAIVFRSEEEKVRATGSAYSRQRAIVRDRVDRVIAPGLGNGLLYLSYEFLESQLEGE